MNAMLQFAARVPPSRARWHAAAVGRLSVDDPQAWVFIIDDCDQPNGRPVPSVTNDAEAVVRDVLVSYPDHRIAYRDTMGRWGELKHRAGAFTGFGHPPQTSRLGTLLSEARL